MKLLSSITLTLLASTLTYAQTTMCFKENHNSMSTIETTKLNGGECKSQYTLTDMKKKGWKVDDIKITPTTSGKYNFIYILKTSTSNSNFVVNSNLTNKQIEDNILKRLEAKKIKDKKEKEIKKALNSKINGKKIYVNKCQSCHGEMGEISTYNVATPLRDMDVDDITYAINKYTNDSSYGNGYQIMMRPIAASVRSEDIENIKAYLDSINKK